MTRLPESLIIRPPSEWRSLLVRITRGCNWNRCRFCGIYPAMGQPDFSVRSLEEIIEDIDMLSVMHPAPMTAFFGDADPLAGGLELFLSAARHVRRAVPDLERLTSYARASTLRRIGREGIKELSAAGLNRIHMGLESGSDDILRFHRKGQSSAMVSDAALYLKEAGIEISFYVLLGLGGRDRWQEHIRETARVINETRPDFVRLRRLWLFTEKDAGMECPLWEQVRHGSFAPQDPEGTVLELKLLIELLEPSDTFLACDHANNYINISGHMDRDRDEMLSEINEFLAMPESRRLAHYSSMGSKI